MIRLTRRRAGSGVPVAFRGDKLRGKSQKLIAAYYAAQQSGGKIAFASSEWKSAKNALKKDARNKCAYCEAPTAVVAHGDVEHFRPKSSYWWLAYCFDNYLFSCQICNQTHKGDKFPISGVLAVSVNMPAAMPAADTLDALADQLSLDASLLDDTHFVQLWGGEQADLVNPYFEDPGPLFVYQVDDANKEIWVLSAGGARADRAMAAAKDCLGINREELLRERYRNYEPLAAFAQVIRTVTDPIALQIATNEVRRMQAADEPFAGMKRWFAAQWGLPGPP